MVPAAPVRLRMLIALTLILLLVGALVPASYTTAHFSAAIRLSPRHHGPRLRGLRWNTGRL